MHAGASAQTEIACHKSAVENLPLYREKNEVAGMEVVVVVEGGVGRGALIQGRERCRKRERMQGQARGNGVLSHDSTNLKRPTFANLSEQQSSFQ